MSWIVTHQCRFQSRTHQQYCVNISKQADVSVEIKQLIGSEHPFITSEANSDDIFTPVRQQTGYLRVLDTGGGTLIDELLPENNTQKMVTLVNLTTGKTEWIGFLAAEVFTQPWGNELKELEFPLKSALACLADVTMQVGATGTNRLALLIYNAFTTMYGEGEVPFTHMVMMDDFANTCDHLLIRANFSKFFRNETIMNDNTETVIRVGETYMKAIKALCATFGVTLRQQGTALVFGRYDNGGDFSINISTLNWSVLAAIANRSNEWPWDDVQPQGQIVTRDLLPIADFRKDNNKLTYIQGGRAAIVSLNVSDAQNGSIIEMPQSIVKDGGVMSVTVGGKGQTSSSGELVVRTISMFFTETIKENFQPSERNGGSESYSYYKANVTFISSTGTWVDNRYVMQVKRWNNRNWTGSTQAEVLESTGFNGNLINYLSTEIKTGAIPGRWGKDNNVVENGILLVQDVVTTYDESTPGQPCYRIESDDNIEMLNCYLNINFEVPLSIVSVFKDINAIGGGYIPTNYSVYVDDSFNMFKSSLTYGLVCRLSMVVDGTTYYWNGAEWETSVVPFPIQVKGSSIESNYDVNMPIDNTGGYYVPVNARGKVVFEILNVVRCSTVMNIKDNRDNGNVDVETPVYPFQKVVTGLTVDLVYPRDITVSTRSSNIYRKTIMDMGFSDNKDIDLELGTHNNNPPSASLLRTWNNEGYVENISYKTSDGTTVAERPEMHLLNRMVEHYKTMRRTMEAKIATGIDIFRQRFSYNGRKFMAIDKKHDWEREEQDVKFIEVN